MNIVRENLGLLLFAASVSAVEAVRSLRDHHLSDHSHGESTATELATQDGVLTVSAPGKVLLAGGYLVLEKENLGITVAGTSRFFTSVRIAPRRYVSSSFTIAVLSPQFNESYLYAYNPVDGKVAVLPGEHSNTFVLKALQVVFSFLSVHFGEQAFADMIAKLHSEGVLELKLRADNDFYSQTENLRQRGLPVNAASLRQLPRFLACPTVDGKIEVAKTGLGSSATLITSLVGALLSFFGAVKLPSNQAKAADSSSLRIVHNLAQLAHGRAQGKIGSGFDVSSAVYGTQVYHRFTPEPFLVFLDDSKDSSINGKELYEAVVDRDRAQWDHIVQPFSLPMGMELLLGDVCGGSNSPSMARAVLQWRERDREAAERLWRSLAQGNQRVLCAFQHLHRLEQQYPAQQYKELLHEVSREPLINLSRRSLGSDLPLSELAHSLLELRSAVSETRALLKEMGQRAGVEIEPEAQTLLCDATQGLPGVVAAGVPGAGGHDAIFALVTSEEAQQSVERLWSSWHETERDRPRVCPLLLRASSSSNGERQTGIRTEEVAW